MKKVFAIKELSNPAGAWFLAILISLLFSGILTHFAIYINMAHNDILFEIRNIQRELDEKNSLLSKLEVEHSRLLSPYVLEQRAEELGMGIPKSGQIRRLDPYAIESEEEAGNNFILQNSN